MTSSRTAAIGILAALLALAAGLLFVGAFPLPSAQSDAAGYLALARSVASGTGFSADGGATPHVYRPPLFSGLLGGWFRLTGTSSVASAAVFQSILHALAVLAAFFLFLEIVPSAAGAACAAFFLAVNPLLVTRVVFVLQEPTILLATVAASLASVRLVRDPSPSRAALAGFAWGLCTLAKAVSGLGPVLLLAMRWLPARLRFRWRGRDAALLLLCFALTVAPWTVRNWLQFARFIPVNGQGEGLLEYNVSHAEIPGAPGAEYAKDVYRKNLPEPERKALLWKYVADHPRYFLVDRVVRNTVHFAAPPRDWWIARGDVRPGEHRPVFWVLAILFHIPLYLLLIRRTVQWGSGLAPPAIGFPIAFYWAYWAVHALLWGDPRYGLAVYPLLVAMALPLARTVSAGDAPRCAATPRTP